ncbi:hypothetical protein ACP81E_23975 [Escherichia coli]|uniref:hypothetical protein n=1 Tax=Escherichia coli TaxID=562 RepID=UPI000DFAFF7A|nr:hypothetical protein [Escherichia coli]MEC6239931.1 hypothetical protein [Escherichia coli]STN91854.1 Uncharacterised protein [Escherichia coli]HAI2246618.1 hypothetical protein [Escherichia coli]HDP5106707.1 hypothetical protein [Escherichia coli]
MFICKSCNEKISNSKMLGLAIGQFGRDKVERAGFLGAFNKEDFIAGLTSGFKIECPCCHKTNWDYKLS